MCVCVFFGGGEGGEGGGGGALYPASPGTFSPKS